MFDHVIDSVDAAAALADQDVIEQFRALERERRQREVELALLMLEVERRNLHQLDGMRTVKSWCRGIPMWTGAEATHAHRLGHLLRQHAATLTVADAQRLPVGHIREIARAAANPRCGAEIAEVMPFLLHWAGLLDHAAFSKVVTQWERSADQDGAYDERHESEQMRRISISPHGYVNGQFPPLDTALLLEVFEHFVEAELMQDWEWAKAEYGDDVTPSKLPRTDAQRRADAFMKMIQRAASMPPGSTGPGFLVVIVVDYETFVAAGGRVATDAATSGASEVQDDDEHQGEDLDADDADDFDDDADDIDDDDVEDDTESGAADEAPAPAERTSDPARRRCESTRGVQLHPDDVFAAAVMGRVRRVVMNSAGVIVNAGRSSRLFTGPLRQALLATGGRCRCRGCNVRRRLEIDHVVGWKSSGRTDAENGDPRCRWHNNLMNKGFSTYRDSDGVWHYYRPDGTEITPF